MVHEHFARSHHFDLRLEKDGVLKSWAVPKGVPESQGVKRLALQTPDHDLKFGAFEGEIPEGESGAGKIKIFDSGSYELHEWTDEEIIFTLDGGQLKGTYNMIRFKKGGERAWLLFRRG